MPRAGLDNIFAIVTPVAVVPLLMGRARTAQHQRDIDFVRWSSLFIGLFFQELNPWNVLCTITPVVLAFLYYLWWWNTVHKSNCRDASPPRPNHGLYAIDATPARWRAPGLSHRLIHWLIHAQVEQSRPKRSRGPFPDAALPAGVTGLHGRRGLLRQGPRRT